MTDQVDIHALLAALGREKRLRVAYADPPYPGCAHLYKDHPAYAGEVDHRTLIGHLEDDFDGWLLHTSSTALRDVLYLCPRDVRVMAWVKPFAAFKRNVPVAYARAARFEYGEAPR